MGPRGEDPELGPQHLRARGHLPLHRVRPLLRRPRPGQPRLRGAPPPSHAADRAQPPRRPELS